MSDLSGFLLVDKPAGITSFQCVAVIRRIVGRSYKVGHTGTLDLFASGLLLIAIGRSATRHIQSFMLLDKKYCAMAKLGELTDTLDYTGSVQTSSEHPKISRCDLEKALLSFGSEYIQTPPIFSALKYEGKRISTLARRKEFSDEQMKQIIESKRRSIKFYDLTLENFDPPYFSIRAHVSHGAYIRVLMNSIAARSGSCATTYALRRTHIGQWSLEKAVPLDGLYSIETLKKNLLEIESVLQSL